MALAKQFWLTVVLLVVATLFFGLSGADIWVQGHFYNPLTHRWIVDTNDEVLKLLFYDGIKRLLIVIAILFLLGLMIGWKKERMRSYR